MMLESFRENRQMQRKVICNYCHNHAVISSTLRGPIWLCVPCDAWVPIFPSSPTAKAMGRLANAELREAKRVFNKAMSPIVQAVGRRRAYEWLTKAMGLTPAECDAHKFDVLQCERATALCLANTPEFLRED